MARTRAAVVAELRRAEARMAELRRDPEFIDRGSDVETEHRLTAIRTARLRSELADLDAAPPPERRTLASKTRY